MAELFLAREADSTANLQTVSACVFLALPEAIFRNLRDDWLCVTDAVMLDSAFCNRRSRELFMALAYEESKVYSMRATSTLYISFLRWCVAREARVDTLAITEGLLRDDELRTKVLTANSRCLTTLYYCNYKFVDRSCPDIFKEIVRLCPNITGVHFDSKSEADQADQVDDCLEVLTRGLQLLSTLTIAVLCTARGIARALAHCKNLSRLTCTGRRVKVNAGIAIPTLTYINCSSAYVEPAVLVALGQRCHELKTLRITYEYNHQRDHHITDAGVRAVLQGCPKLRETDLAQSARISDGLRVELAAHCNFTRLDLSKWERTSEELAQDVLTACPNLTEVDCFHCKWLTDATLAVCAQHCPRLESLSLWACTNVTTDGVRTLVAERGRQLSQINLMDCSQLEDGAVFAVAEHCPRLLEIKCPPNVSDASMVKLAEGCPQLTTVFLSISVVGDAGVAALATHCPKLTALYLRGSINVTIQGIRALAKHCRLLTHLELPPHLDYKSVRIRQLMGTTCAVSFW
jgi:hypothetical protein